MHKESYLLGMDVGTTGAKALLIDRAGRVVTSATSEYPMFTPRPLWTEQHPADWWAATARSIRQLLAEAGIEPICTSGAGSAHDVA